MNKLDLVIPHLNYPDFQVGIDTLRRNSPEGLINKIIFINQSDVSRPRDVDIEVRCKNLGFAKAMNTGIRLSDAPMVGCLNDDVVFLNKKWWEGIEQTFDDYSTALCVNPSSVCDPDGVGGTTIRDGFEYKEDYSDEEYDRLLNPGVIDGICMWFPIFNRERLDQVKGVVPGKAWFDERFLHGGGDDYDLNRRGYMSGFRSLGTGKSCVWHWWHKTKHPVSGEIGPKDDSATWLSKWELNGEMPDLYGQQGLKEVPPNIVRDVV